MNGTLIIGNKFYSKLNFDPLVDHFDENFRCNMTWVGKNNGTKHDKLGLCSHLHNTLIVQEYNEKQFSDYYQKEFKKEEIKEFFERFDKTKYDKVFYAHEKGGQYNIWLKEKGCPHHFSMQPRTGYVLAFDNIMQGKKVFITNFSIRDENRLSYYVKDTVDESQCHSKKDELSIIKWLHENDKADATLCMLEDEEVPTISCDVMNPTIEALSIIIEHNKECILKHLKNTEFLSILSDKFNIKSQDEAPDSYIITHKNETDNTPRDR